VAFSAPHVAEVGQSISIVPNTATAVFGELHWGDGRVTFLEGGWNASTPSNLTSHVYATPGHYAIEYIAYMSDGTTPSTSMLVGVVGAGATRVPDASPGCTGAAPKRVLFVGNSQIVVNDLPRIVASVASSAPAACPRIISTSLATGGVTLDELWASGSIEAELRSGAYDTVVIAESIDLVQPLASSFANTFYTVGQQIISLARAQGVRPVLYATPSLLSPQPIPEFAAMATYHGILAATHGVSLAASGLAWLRVWDSLPTLRLHASDDGHPNYVGSVLSGYVLYAAITGASPVGLTANPSTECDEGCIPISAATAAVLQEAAWQQQLLATTIVKSPAVIRPQAKTKRVVR
jgi:hypothetical protein